MKTEDEVYLEIEPKIFESLKKKSMEEFNNECPNDERDIYWFPNLDFECQEDEWKDGYLTLSGRMSKDEEDFGYVSIKMKMNQDRVLEIISDYMKRLGKLKTVLEATK